MTAVGGKRVEIAIGPERSLSLATTREIAAGMREAVATGRDPRSVMAQKVTPASAPISFGDFADDYISSVEAGWKNQTHRQQWRNSLRDHAASIRAKPVEDIDTDDILTVLQPIWLTLPETANRVRGRIERILNAAKAKGLRAKDTNNPAQLRGHIELLLPKQPGMVRGHHAALPYKDVAQFMVELRSRSALAARCLEFTILTAARSGEALGATWSEIDTNAKLWNVPATRMKAGVAHTVPLTRAALELLEDLKPEKPEGGDRIFAIDGASRSNMAMAMLLRRMKYSITTHGFRSTFRDWAGDCTSYPRELIEAALAHTIQNKVERAYRRGTAIERRRQLMEDWATFLDNRPKTSSVPT